MRLILEAAFVGDLRGTGDVDDSSNDRNGDNRDEG
jgi:hypothetical protein